MSTPTLDRIGTGLATLPRVNLLPPELIVQRRLRTIQYASGGTALVALAAVAAAAVLAGAGVTEASDRLDSARAQQTAAQQQVNSYGDVMAVDAQAGSVDELLKTASSSEVRWSRYLNTLATTTPKTMWVTSMTATPSTAAAPDGTTVTTTATTDASAPVATISFDGVALSKAVVANWLEILAGQSEYSNVALSSITEQTTGDRVTYAYNITLDVTQAALQSNVASVGTR